MRASALLGALLVCAAAPLLGCPHLIYAIPTMMTPTPRFSGVEPAPPEAEFVPLSLDFRSEGHFLLFRLRVDGQNLEPSAGTCRRWFLLRGAHEVQTAGKSFCDEDDVKLDLAAGVPHTLELVVGSEHTVAKRVVLEPGANVRWKMPITTRHVEVSITPERDQEYTLRAREEVLNLANAMPRESPRGTNWKLDAYEPIYKRGVEVGLLRIEVLRGPDDEVVSAFSVPLYSGRMGCEPPFCEVEAPPQSPEKPGGSDGASMRTKRSG